MLDVFKFDGTHIPSPFSHRAFPAQPSNPPLWSLHPWLLAHLSALHRPLSTAYIAHLSNRTAVQTDARGGSSATVDWDADDDADAEEHDGEDSEAIVGPVPDLTNRWAMLMVGPVVLAGEARAALRAVRARAEVVQAVAALPAGSEVAAMWERLWAGFYRGLGV
ncbi:hypothetical protein BDK51DRAFT_39059 [Blyttiomyces helicus]|uniref:Uncharacterized protein n=1 Tax=Blyttiomyces helicus TaxID=388810 RepID=A0A4P9W1X5_9FUNG|nr:hypothetical protein BDK51DRAFT_39059 [Blyttiomyces helicus]|eukprot:RKO86199.1 hypothetical protein BDK51DRAFT_39059 [Blyttiomyces helicus]